MFKTSNLFRLYFYLKASDNFNSQNNVNKPSTWSHLPPCVPIYSLSKIILKGQVVCKFILQVGIVLNNY